MNVGVTGYDGRLGKVLVDNLHYEKCGVGNAAEFDTIIHAAAYTDVDGAERDIGACFASNVIYTDRLRKSTDAKIIYLSTDFVFDGLGGPYGEWDAENPLSVYGLSKELGERTLYKSDLIIRTTVLYDSHKDDFVTWVLKELQGKGQVEVSENMITSPTNVHHLAEALTWLVDNPTPHSIINVACMNSLSRYKFAQLIAMFANYPIDDVIPVQDIVFGEAHRPIRGGLNTELAQNLGIPIYSVWDGLKLMSEENKLWHGLVS